MSSDIISILCPSSWMGNEQENIIRLKTLFYLLLFLANNNSATINK